MYEYSPLQLSTLATPVLEDKTFQISILHIFTFNTAHFAINTAQSVQYCTLK